jgi:hypothetical protein
VPNTYQLIASVTVGAGGAASMDFTSIPSTYTDLVILMSSKRTNSGGSGSAMMQFNGVTTSYSYVRVFGNGSTASSGSGTDPLIGEAGEFSETGYSSNYVYIPNYTSSNNKSYSADGLRENNATAAFMQFIAGLWSNTAAITSISIKPVTGTWIQYTTATLYGIKNS